MKKYKDLQPGDRLVFINVIVRTGKPPKQYTCLINDINNREAYIFYDGDLYAYTKKEVIKCMYYYNGEYDETI